MNQIHLFTIRSPLFEEISIVKEDGANAALLKVQQEALLKHAGIPCSIIYVGSIDTQHFANHLNLPQKTVTLIESAKPEEHKTTPEQMAQYLKDNGWVCYKKKNHSSSSSSPSLAPLG